MDDGAGSFDRRIGRRCDTDARVVYWHESPAEGGSAERPRQQALLLDLSISGAGLVVATDWAPPLGATIVIDIDGRLSRATVKRTDKTDNPLVTELGIAFFAIQPPFQAVLNEIIGGPPPPVSPYWD